MTKSEADAGQGRDDLLDHAVREVLLLGITAHVREGQDGDGGLVGQRERLRMGGSLQL